jgi:hypothetical protein
MNKKKLTIKYKLINNAMKWIFKKLVVVQLVTFFGILQLEPESLFLHSQGTATNSYPELDEFIPQTHIL